MGEIPYESDTNAHTPQKNDGIKVWLEIIFREKCVAGGKRLRRGDSREVPRHGLETKSHVLIFQPGKVSRFRQTRRRNAGRGRRRRLSTIQRVEEFFILTSPSFSSYFLGGDPALIYWRPLIYSRVILSARREKNKLRIIEEPAQSASNKSHTN